MPKSASENEVYRCRHSSTMIVGSPPHSTSSLLDSYHKCIYINISYDPSHHVLFVCFLRLTNNNLYYLVIGWCLTQTAFNFTSVHLSVKGWIRNNEGLVGFWCLYLNFSRNNILSVDTWFLHFIIVYFPPTFFFRRTFLVTLFLWHPHYCYLVERAQ